MKKPKLTTAALSKALALPLAEADEWSIVMTGFKGKCERFEKAALEAFQHEGLDALYLCDSAARPKRLPIELATNLPHSEADAMAKILRKGGARLRLVSTREVKRVRGRAFEVWPDKLIDGFSFTEVESLILLPPALSARHALRETKRRLRFSPCWEWEKAINFKPFSASASPRESLRNAHSYSCQLAQALEKAYPERDFVVSNAPGLGVSVYQWEAGAPCEDQPPLGPLFDQAWCERCQTQQKYRLCERPETQFPRTEWGRCLECGSALFLRGWETLTRASQRMYTSV